MADRKDGRPAPPTESTIRGADWDSRDLTGEEHERVLFLDVDMTEAHGTGASFVDCTFRGVRFNVSVHTDTVFTNCTFVRCGFFDSTFSGCKLLGSMFDGCTYDLMKVQGGDWSFTGLPGADLRRASFTDVRMREADLTGARFAGATLRGVDLSGAWLRAADLSRCDLRGSDISTIDPRTVELKGARIDHQQAVVIAGSLGLDVH
ncbi:pentapeptide repeat-containing protein [Actinomadura sp. LOL_016]|uniref:pentapeptide repeat-containing protein n=2 Tax=unclassified Actinomadura TaxID=2626254 RepID=UPI003A8BC110